MLPDLGIAIHNNTITLNQNLVLSITPVTLIGQKLRCTRNSTEFCLEVFQHMGSFVVPLSHNQLLKQLKDDGLVSFKMVEVGELIVLNRLDSFRPIKCQLQCLASSRNSLR